jgi:hypothetical protein
LLAFAPFPVAPIVPAATTAVAKAPALSVLPPVTQPGTTTTAVTVRLIVNRSTYPLAFGGKTPDEVRRLLDEATSAVAALHQATGMEYWRVVEEASRRVAALPPAPTVDLTLEFRNTGARPVQLDIGGDGGHLTLDLQGPGAVSLPTRLFMTYEYRLPLRVTLAPGQTYRLAVGSLDYGLRGDSDRAYWTETGEYKLTARYQTSIFDPPPKPVKNGPFPVLAGGGVSATLTAAPVTLHVVAPGLKS